MKVRRAVFLGAGASRAFGYPLTTDLLGEIRTRLKRKVPLFEAGAYGRQAERTLLRLLCRYFPGFAEKSLVLPSITHVLSLIDHAIAAGVVPVPGSSRHDLAELRKLLEWAMCKIIEDEEDPYTARQREILDAFCAWLREGSGRAPAAVISTNYDLSVDRELFYGYRTHKAVSEGFDFGFPWRDPDFEGRLYHPPRNPKHHFYKLHGSVSWLRCETCGYAYINTDGAILDRAFEKRNSDNECECGHAPLSPVLVAPSLVRDIRDPNLLSVWKSASELLRTANEWFIVGYSLPSEDLAIRSLLLRAYHARGEGSAKPRVCVVQKGDWEETRSNYKLFFPKCLYRTDGLEGFLGLGG